MERRFILFLVLSFAVLFGYSALLRRNQPPVQPKQQAVADREKKEDEQPPGPMPEEVKPTDEPAVAPHEEPEKKTPAVIAPAPEPEPEHPERWVTLGSADHDEPFRMLVTLTTKGAALARVELNDPRYRNVDERYGFLGHVASHCDKEGNGCRVRFVGRGTPADEAGLKSGDLLKALDGHAVSGPGSLRAVLRGARPGQEVVLSIVRDGEPKTLTATLRRIPLDVIAPEGDDPLSMLLTLSRFDDLLLAKQKDKDEGADGEEKKADDAPRPRDKAVSRELDGLHLRTANWKLVEANKTCAVFSFKAPDLDLEFVKTYRLAEVPEQSLPDKDYPAYHLIFEVEIRNIGRQAHKVAYQLDGPNGLPLEGKWYAYRVSRNWGGAGLRDFIISFDGGEPAMINASNVADRDVPAPWSGKSLRFIGVDAQYFSAVLMPEADEGKSPLFEELTPICVGEVDAKNKSWANTSCRLTSVVVELEPGGPPLKHALKLFAGPKRPPLLENKAYDLGELVYYGWPIFAAVAVPLTKLLHLFYAVTFNYGLAIILLTVLVRGCMFPLSRKQAIGAQKMQQLQPEIKKIQQKYKSNVEARTKAQQELFRKHNYNPLSGCLPIFIQLPIFIGLYRALMVDVELRDAPLLTSAIRWCSNLAAPDMLFDWSGFMPDWINSGQGIFGLGPYFNLLPVLTIFLFIAQQKMFMPPAADEQAAMQQKIMKYMMVFMGLLFFKVASGLCIYFIASSLWGLAERKYLPKAAPAAALAAETRAEAKARQRQEAELAMKKKKKKE
ncbi:MAG: membrane protein insertase YidC [Pirellulales bacterium]|nr:membrane protein insertase YidC [Pirellulales bacterium]